jgi:ABC-type branched-subunit amino acid transport system substrate-binding protein
VRSRQAIRSTVHRPNSVILSLFLALTLVAMLGACVQQPPAPEPAAPEAVETEAMPEEPMAEEPTEAPPAEPTGELPVGILLPFTGQYAWVGSNVQPVAQMIVDEVNESGGIDGATIRLVQGDTEGVVDAGTTAAQKLVNVDQVLALLGPTSLSFTGVRQVVADNGVPMVSPTAGTTELNQAGTEYFYRTVPSDSLGGRAIARATTDAEYLDRDEPFSTISLMVGQAPALISFRDPIVEGLEEFGGSAAEVVEYTTGKQSYRSEVQTALAPDPDLIILIGNPEDSARIMQNAFEAGYEGTWFVTQDQTTSEFIELASPDLVEGIYGLEEVPAAEAEALQEAFAQRLVEYSGNEPQIFGTNTYDAANVLFLAMLRAQLEDGEVTRQTIADNIPVVANPDEEDVVVNSYTEGMEALRAGEGIDYQGLVGPVDFDEYGNITAPFGIRQVQDGEWVTVATVSAGDLQ